MSHLIDLAHMELMVESVLYRRPELDSSMVHVEGELRVRVRASFRVKVESRASSDLQGMQIAVVVIGRNERARLGQCLSSIFSMHYPSDLLEVVYVDSDSSDGSAEQAESMGVKVLRLKGSTTAARGRNAGWMETDAPFVLFLDGDTVVDPNFARRALEAIVDPLTAGVWGNRREADPEGSIYNAVLDLDWLSTSGWTLYFGGDALVRRSALQAVGGFNEGLVAGEEPEMCRRMRGLGYRISHIDVPMTQHDLSIHNWRQYWNRSIRTGNAYAEVSRLYARTHDPLWLKESRSNVTRVFAWLAFIVVGALGSVYTHSLVPLIGLFLCVIGILGRTANRVRSRSASLRVTLAYGVHSHVQQLPIFLGQVGYYLRQLLHRRPAIIEYRQS